MTRLNTRRMLPAWRRGEPRRFVNTYAGGFRPRLNASFLTDAQRLQVLASRYNPQSTDHENRRRRRHVCRGAGRARPRGFSRLERLFDERFGQSGKPRIIEWHDEGRFRDHPKALAEALTCASFLGRTTVAEYLLTQGVNPSGGAGTGLDALHWAANRGQLEAVRLLIRAQAPLETRSMHGGTALGTAIWSAVNEPREDKATVVAPDQRAAVLAPPQLPPIPPDTPAGVRAEFEEIAKEMTNDGRQARSLPSLPSIPIAVVVATPPGRMRGASGAITRLQIQRTLDLVLSVPNGLLVTASHVGHDVHASDPVLVTRLVEHVLNHPPSQ